MKVAIALTPVAAYALQNYQSSGGGINGLTKGILPTISTAYTGYNPNDKKWRLGDMTIGYVPLAGAWIFGKIASRVLRV
jgi:hypothetical protein